MRMDRMRTGMVAVVLAVAVGSPVAFAKDGGGHGHGHGHGRGGGSDATAPGNDEGGTDARGPGESHSGGGGGPKHGGACDAASVDALDMAFTAACPCDGVDDGAGGVTAWKNHGRYVRCVAHALRDAGRAAGLKRKCAKDLLPCAASSTCGKAGAVTCLVAMTDTCVAGACTNDAARPCVVDADCTTTACGVVSATDCSDAGGTAGSTPSCCTASPSGAFVE